LQQSLQGLRQRRTGLPAGRQAGLRAYSILLLEVKFGLWYNKSLMDGYHKTTLSNGLRLLTVPMNSVASATVMIIVGAGSRYERKNINGISHFLEHMAFKGTQKRPSALIISSIIEGIGGEFNAFTSKDHTAYYVKAAKQHLPLLFDILSDMLLNSLFAEEEIKREKGVICEEINLYEDTPIRKIGTLYEELIYGDHPLGWDIAGKKEVIQKITRENFLEYVGGLYSPNNTIISVAGGIGKNGEALELTKRWLGNWVIKPIWHFEKISDKQTKPRVLVSYKKTEQAHLCLGVPAYSRDHKDHFILEVLSAILGGGMSSRLFIQVRERRGLAYYVRSETVEYKEIGNFVTQAGVDLKRIDDAIKVILNEYFYIANNRVTAEELNKAKEFLKGRLILELEDSKNVAGLYGFQELLDKKVYSPKEMIGEIDKVTALDIQRVAKDIFQPEKLNLAVIGPFKEKERFENLLK